MQLENEFVVPVPKAQAWAVLMDVERVAPCLPGATFDGYEGDGFNGRVKVKLGPITVTYTGSARFVEQDETAGRAVIEAAGKQARGAGTANATVHAQLTEQDGSTRVRVVTDLNVTGRPAQFGRGVMADVSSKLVDQFADCLAAQITSGTGPTEPAAAAAAESAAGPSEEPAEGPPVEPAEGPAAGRSDTTDAAGTGIGTGIGTDIGTVKPAAQAGRPAVTGPAGRPTSDAIDLVDVAGVPVLRRLVPALAGLVAVLVCWRLLRRARR
jgi:uncharacterized protein